jgi:hypothetical protein
VLEPRAGDPLPAMQRIRDAQGAIVLEQGGPPASPTYTAAPNV